MQHEGISKVRMKSRGESGITLSDFTSNTGKKEKIV